MALGLGLAWSLSTVALAQTYGSKPIRVIVPFPPGGGTDLIARETTQAVANNTKWVFVIENKPGAGGNLGVAEVAKAPPDGYTLVLGQTSNLSINPSLYARLPYNPLKDLAPITLVADAPLVYVTSANSPFRSMSDVVQQAKAKPDAINFASSGNGTVSHLASELLQRTAGVKFTHVPYKGVGMALTDVVSGNVDLYLSSLPTLLGHIRQGKLRALAVTSDKRLPEIANVPTLGEAGYKAAASTTWFGFLAPAGTPPDVIARLNAEFNKALKQPALVKKMNDEGARIVTSTPAEFSRLIQADLTRWGTVVKEAHVSID
ncbi:tripartite tricarboxylate transporter substrate binding protein [Roseateles sp. SL47]|uniref:Bug family tripartite tricarboxylate transporter substrate binding protein n=1 Tax=Roseateles sp. SL47 TaxID=2995138 RepID=UPI00226F3E37|nr:tripartite tricarboxylate transporter substrate binding protein [Roseateles sp. SL47]WAC75843.1 tripartite tricarboxylate transporter substrate binding protein [Roseateles sp. SL47]